MKRDTLRGLVRVCFLAFLVAHLLMFDCAKSVEAQQANPAAGSAVGASAAKEGSKAGLAANTAASSTTLQLSKAEPAASGGSEGTASTEKAVTDLWIAASTVATAVFTLVLAIVTYKLWKSGEKQIAVARSAADSAKDAAEAAVNASRPYLYPRLIDLKNLHPDLIVDGNLYKSEVTFVFENYGATPAMIREVRAQLLLVDRDQLPDTPPAGPFPDKTEFSVIPGNTRGEDAVRAAGAAITCSSSGHSAEEIRQVIVNYKKGAHHRRFYLQGYVVYDDFFGNRNTQWFCIKMRKTGFQVPKGGSAYNRVDRMNVPVDDLLNPGLD
jgi:hypothetical protein